VRESECVRERLCEAEAFENEFLDARAAAADRGDAKHSGTGKNGGGGKLKVWE
jgi:hypothetical protein